MAAWTIPLLSGVGVLLALEVAYLLLRRFLPGLRLRGAYHLWAVSLAALVVVTRIGFDHAAMAWKIIAGSALVLSAWVAFGLLNAAVIKRPWRPEAPLMPKLARDIVRMGLLVGVGLLAAKAIFQVELGAIVVSSTVLSAIIGLALQDVLKNVFAGVALDVEKSFSRGDWLLIDGKTHARVVDMSWRATRLRTRQGVDIFEPNAQISNVRLVNYGSGERPVAVEFRIGLSYDAPPNDVKRALTAAARSVTGTLEQPPAGVLLDSFADHAIIYSLWVWTHRVADLGRFRDAVNTRIWYELKRRTLDVPFPIRTVHLHSAESLEGAARDAGRQRATRRLSQLELFRALDPEVMQTLVDGAALRHYDDGEILVREGEPGESLLVIDAGSTIVSKASAGPDGAEVDVGQLGAGNFFGEQSLLTGEPRSATVRADGGCVVLEISKAQLAEILTADPTIAETLSHALAERQQLTAASLASHDERRRTAPPASEASILARIRTFFSLR